MIAPKLRYKKLAAVIIMPQTRFHPAWTARVRKCIACVQSTGARDEMPQTPVARAPHVIKSLASCLITCSKCAHEKAIHILNRHTEEGEHRHEHCTSANPSCEREDEDRNEISQVRMNESASSRLSSTSKCESWSSAHAFSASRGWKEYVGARWP